MLKAHQSYLALSESDGNRTENYKSLFSRELEKPVVDQIRNALRFNMSFGDNRFKKEIVLAIGQAIGFAKRGRPTKSALDT